MNNNKIDPGSPLLALQQQQILLRMEYEYEKEESNDRRKQWVLPKM